MKKETYTASAIRHLAPSAHGDMVAVALFERVVSLWDLTTGAQISEFETILDFGGARLALSQEESACLAAAYNFHGLACYDTPSGRLRWQRKDLKKIQQVVVTPDGSSAYCCFDEGPCQVISISTGETTESIRSLRGVWMDLGGEYQFHESRKLSVVNRDKKEAFRFDPESFGVLAAAISKTHLAISESGTDVRVFDLSSGEQVVRHVQPQNHHVLELSPSPDSPLFYGVQWKYQNGGSKLLLRFSPDGPESDVIRNLGQPAVVAFCRGGRDLLTSEGDVVDCRSGNTMLRLPFPQKQYQKG